MSEKSTDVAGFAAFARTVQECKANVGNFNVKVDYIKSLYEVVRQAGISEKVDNSEEKLYDTWQTFVVGLQVCTFSFLNSNFGVIITFL